MFDTAATATDPISSRVRIVHAGGTLNVELLPGSATVLDLTASKGKRGGAAKVLGFLGIAAFVAGAGWAGSAMLLSRTPAPAVADVAPWPSRKPIGPAAWPTLPGLPETAQQVPIPAAPPLPSPPPSARDPFGLVQQ